MLLAAVVILVLMMTKIASAISASRPVMIAHSMAEAPRSPSARGGQALTEQHPEIFHERFVERVHGYALPFGTGPLGG